ncbi:hypothetical protein [Shinella zoogloeoides]|uniref:Uncharacterized protein n=1 Tax=Shinella zoogloeoides TaxID=352475 RepID=A0A6N8TKE2_SHIZO|nr:hypothetical protein [Shinella zoogloeoides]MXO01574.1 hypothetical protein [Shinella zoogloeoides]UEX80188.1 hypothetical protein K8M09_11165 [Shinella zoogloeoides]
MTFRVVYDLATGERQEIPLTPEEIAALEPIAPEPPPNEISRRQFFQELANRELITKEEALAAITSGTLPAEFETLVAAILDEDIEWQARMALCGATTFLRTNWFVDYFAAMKGFSSAYMDDLWSKAFLIT